MFLPYLQPEDKETEQIINFAGLNRNEKIASNEFNDCKNVSLDKYPLLSPRGERYTESLDLAVGETIVAISEYDGNPVYVTEKTVSNYEVKYRTTLSKSFEIGNGNSYTFGEDEYIVTYTNMEIKILTNPEKRLNSKYFSYNDENKTFTFNKEDFEQDYGEISGRSIRFRIQAEYLATEGAIDNANDNAFIQYALYCDGNKYLLNDWQTDLGQRGSFYSRAEKDWWVENNTFNTTPNISIVKMGALLYVYPFGKFVNMALPAEERTLKHTEQDKPLIYRIKFEPCDVDGNVYDVKEVGPDAPDKPTQGECWYDTQNKVIKQYDANTDSWYTVASNYIKISQNEVGNDGINFEDINLYDRILLTPLKKLKRRQMFKVKKSGNNKHEAIAVSNEQKGTETSFALNNEYVNPVVQFSQKVNGVEISVPIPRTDYKYYHANGYNNIRFSPGKDVTYGVLSFSDVPQQTSDDNRIVVSEPTIDGGVFNEIVSDNDNDKKTFISAFYGMPYEDKATSEPREAIVYKTDEKEHRYIVIKGLAPFALYVNYSTWMDEIGTPEPPLRIIKEMPKLDFAMSCNNRIWGCRYGEGSDGKMLNEIYASGLGDPDRWFSFPGLASDSFTQSVGTEGEWTGCVNYLGSPIFFKENGLYRIYGSNPSQYQLVSNENCRGCESGSERSLAVLNEVLFYKSRDGICTYTGSLPTCISDKLGASKYHNAIATADRNKYYVSMQNTAGEREFFVYDIRLGMWVKEDDLDVKSIYRVGNDVCVFGGAEFNWLTNLDEHPEATKEQPFEWDFTTGRMYTDYSNRKYIDNLTVRCNMQMGSVLSFFIEYDSNGVFLPVGTVTSKKLGVISLPIKIKRCDHLRLKVVGRGYSEIYGIEQQFCFGGKE